ncbi:polysaccharide deacetylase [Rhizorhabdus wittichii DC-6]|jgi:cellulose synthase/poly-beta-1,6-N-acetylglucosamine synthase-like glycosyltransferase/peptidoglycan/xylan/chitin deacetylase (PgdA/CDA1 family)/spore germination protein YaaH|uniref:Chitooligosaccharide deacetylase n=1 Tax=Rhizorhabdus wittichii TaxID=160791 RepID=A0A975HE72_9SPHN|nr:glycosyltransferase [Rhizorhabdus wittichii]ARR54059.1 polysaccharide deacetylase [Rhizorhabdus wittichii DC-6]QTH20504.1 glycosyltransferase [Rhizorhabdus wittichii]
MDSRPIFYDASGRRRRRFALAIAAFALLLLLSAVAFFGSIIRVTPQPPLPFEVERPAIAPLKAADHSLVGASARKVRHMWRDFRRLLAHGTAGAGMPPTAYAFHAPWDDASAASLARHVDDIDWLIPGWISITGPDHKVTSFPDARGKAIISHAHRRPKLMPMIQNALGGAWDGPGIAALLRDPKARAATLDRVAALLAANQASGVFFDFEELPADAHPAYRAFLTEARRRLPGMQIAIAVPVADATWDLKAYARVADKLFLMAYDEHSEPGDPGPIASRPWFADSVARAVRGLPPDRVVVALGSYAYDWEKGGDTIAHSVEDVWLAAHDSGVVPRFDPASGNSSFAYLEGGVRHDIWLLDAAAMHGQIATLRTLGLHQVALWRLGTEDPSVWTMFGRGAGGGRRLPSAQAIEDIPAGNNVDIEGSGEILRIGAVPVPGHRSVTTDRAGMITAVRFDRLPTPYQIERTGYRPKLVALTFDDGPDPVWTPKILDILKAEKVSATFFIVGENALTQRSLLERLVAEGHEVGSHTYTHPNLAQATAAQTALELNANQRLFQAYTGRSLRLFRAPYFGDAEPTTADEIVPVEEAQRRGYLSVGLHVDPDDWKRPGVAEIVQRTIDGVESGSPDFSANVVLLHDSGGDRAQTVAALPLVINALRARGYQLVPVSVLAGLSPATVNPPISEGDRLAAQTDLALFSTLGWITIAIKWLFIVAISLGIARAVLLSGLALVQARREARTVFPPVDPDRFVTVLIPAYNEERVIERSVRRVLDSRDVRVEVIVIDDGSKDRTSAVVAEAFADEPRVRLLTVENGGKARALNRGLELVQGEIVIALDADTQFEPATIARLARWFDDPALGAVAGNAKVGNRINLVTRWQALEYITAQNLERRALARLNAMTVVPGAVGAWRLAAIRAVGGYPPDTLAEDQDLTIAIQRAGWGVHYDQYAVAWTEAPESVRALAKQRFRWAYGTLQCLWKHRRVMASGEPRGLARIGLPQAVLFQILLAAISPVIDLALIVSLVATWFEVQAHGWAQSSTDIDRMLAYWLIFTAIDLLAAFIAFALERREKWRLLWLLIPQRIGYRQIMYYVVLKALAQALRGPRVGWGKLERSGRVATG